jgi:hypothetical protein
MITLSALRIAENKRERPNTEDTEAGPEGTEITEKRKSL